jgi:hypothetical protein
VISLLSFAIVVFEITVDDVGRPSISCAVVRQLIQELRETESRAKEMNDQRFAQLEGERLARLPKGLPWYEVPAGMSAAEAMVAAGGDDGRPRTVPTAGEWRERRQRGFLLSPGDLPAPNTEDPHRSFSGGGLLACQRHGEITAAISAKVPTTVFTTVRRTVRSVSRTVFSVRRRMASASRSYPRRLSANNRILCRQSLGRAKKEEPRKRNPGLFFYAVTASTG